MFIFAVRLILISKRFGNIQMKFFVSSHHVLLFFFCSSANFKDNYLQVMPKVWLDRIDVDGNYNLGIKFNGAPLELKGKFAVSLLDVKVHGDARVRLSIRNGNEYAKVEQAKLMFDSIKAGNVKFSLPFGGQLREPGMVLNFILKQHGEFILKSMYKILEERIDRIHIDVVNEFIKDVPATFFLTN